jgi:ABC-2 type transport system ATP-binding protein
MTNAIEVRGLRKAYGDTEAVRGVDLTVAPGEVFALLGPNGAGKTTTAEILEGYRLAGAGEVRVLGHDPGRGERGLRERIGVVLQQTGLQHELTVGEILEMYGRYYPRRRSPEELIELVRLDAKRDARVKTLSGGQRRRLDLALALVGDPELVFLDEPTTGFDPAARRAAWDTIRDLAAHGRTIFLTTHFMDEAQTLADRVAVMTDGRIVAEGSPDELGGRELRAAEIRFRLPAGVGATDLPPLDGAGVAVDGDSVLVTAADDVGATHSLTGWALERGLALRGFSVQRPTLEDLYLELTQGGRAA